MERKMNDSLFWEINNFDSKSVNHNVNGKYQLLLKIRRSSVSELKRRNSFVEGSEFYWE